MNVNATDRCSWCHREFADHNYVKDSIDQYECPQPHIESVYGYFSGGDPRDFFPDAGDCTPEELENHRMACIEATKYEAKRRLECPSYFLVDDEGWRAHVLKAPFGIGVQNIKMQTFFEAEERDYEDGDD